MEFNKHMKTTELIEFLRAKNVPQEACELLAGKYNKKFGFVSQILKHFYLDFYTYICTENFIFYTNFLFGRCFNHASSVCLYI